MVCEILHVMSMIHRTGYYLFLVCKNKKKTPVFTIKCEKTDDILDFT